MSGEEPEETAENASDRLVVFTLNEQRYALHLSALERVVRVVEITPLPKAPEVVLGVVNVQGRIIPVVNIRKRFRLPEREMDPRDQLILAHTLCRPVTLVSDAAVGVETENTAFRNRTDSWGIGPRFIVPLAFAKKAVLATA